MVIIFLEESSEGNPRPERAVSRRWKGASGDEARMGQIIFEIWVEETSWLRTCDPKEPVAPLKSCILVSISLPIRTRAAYHYRNLGFFAANYLSFLKH